MIVEKNHKITVCYTLSDNNGEFIEKADQKAPLVYLHGYKYILPPLEEALEGHKVGDVFKVQIPCEKAFGPYKHELLIAVPKEDLDGIPHLKEGMEVEILQDSVESVHEKKDMFWVPQTPEDLFKDSEGHEAEDEEEEEEPEIYLVREIRDRDVILDGNPFLAGRDLVFEVEIIEVEPASFEEIEEMYLKHREGDEPNEGLF